VLEPLQNRKRDNLQKCSLRPFPHLASLIFAARGIRQLRQASQNVVLVILIFFFRFITTALQQSTVRLTWDETDPRRVQTTMKNFSKDDILDMDFKAYLASSSDEKSDGEIEETGNKKENEDRQIAKYKVGSIVEVFENYPEMLLVIHTGQA
jgi:hypothetical protein